MSLALLVIVAESRENVELDPLVTDNTTRTVLVGMPPSVVEIAPLHVLGAGS